MAFVIDDILLGPFKLVQWIAKELYEHGEAEMTDESVIRHHLLEIQMQFELDEISEQEYRNREDALMHRLDEIRKYKEEHEID